MPIYPGVGEQIPSTDPSPLDRAISREEERLVQRALARIPERYRMPLVLFYTQQQSLEEVAEMLGISLPAASKRLLRGRRMLHDQVVGAILGRIRPRKEMAAGIMA